MASVPQHIRWTAALPRGTVTEPQAVVEGVLNARRPLGWPLLQPGPWGVPVPPPHPHPQGGGRWGWLGTRTDDGGGGGGDSVSSGLEDEGWLGPQTDIGGE